LNIDGAIVCVSFAVFCASRTIERRSFLQTATRKNLFGEIIFEMAAIMFAIGINDNDSAWEIYRN